MGESLMTEKEIALKIQEREKYPYELALKKAKRVLAMNEPLLPCLEDWFNDKKCEFDYNGINLEYIQSKISCTEIDSLLIMNRMLVDENYINEFKKMEIIIK